jgi:hypothetical protein
MEYKCELCGSAVSKKKYRMCKACRLKPGNNGNYKDGRYLKEYFCSCGAKISKGSGIYGDGKCRKCADKEHSERMQGAGSWNYKGGKSRFPKCLDCGKQLTGCSYTYCLSCANKGDRNKFLNACKSNPKLIEDLRTRFTKLRKEWVGEKHPNWRGGKSFEPYSSDFSNVLKLKILRKFGYACQLCKKIYKKAKLDVHHIDYDKKNSVETNLIPLCDSCHSKTHYNRDKWKERFSKLIKQETLV